MMSYPCDHCGQDRCDCNAPEVSKPASEEWPSGQEIHNRFCGHEGNICQACQIKAEHKHTLHLNGGRKLKG